MKVTFYRAADAFLYLPTYVADKKKIFKDFDVTADFFEWRPDQPTGDYVALRHVLNAKDRGIATHEIPIAICDPVAIFHDDFTRKSRVDSKFVILGALITRPPFWLVDGDDCPPTDDETELADVFQNIISYDESLITASHIGRNYSHKLRVPLKPTKYGQEFDAYFAAKRATPDLKTAVVTCDLVAMSLCCDIDNDPSSPPRASIAIPGLHSIHSCVRSPHYEHFVTTALVTTRDVIQNDQCHRELINVLAAIQASVALFRGSRDIALDVCMSLRSEPRFYLPEHERLLGEVRGQFSLEAPEIAWIVDTMRSGRLYADPLTVSEQQWRRTLAGREAPGIPATTLRKAAEDFSLYVNTDIMLAAQEMYCRGIGVNTEEVAMKIMFSQGYMVINQERYDVLNNYEARQQRRQRAKLHLLGLILVSLSVIMFVAPLWTDTGGMDKVLSGAAWAIFSLGVTLTVPRIVKRVRDWKASLLTDETKPANLT